MYGAWIHPRGTIIQVEGKCEHTLYLSYRDASDEGWIATINPMNPPADLFCARFNIETVTIAALTTLLRLVKETDCQLIAEDLYCSFSHYGLGRVKTKREDIAFIRNLIKEKRSI